MKNRTIALIAILTALGMLAHAVHADEYIIKINVPEKIAEWIGLKINKSGKSINATIEDDVIKYYNEEYDTDLSLQMIDLATKCMESDYKVQINCIDALQKIVGK